MYNHSLKNKPSSFNSSVWRSLRITILVIRVSFFSLVLFETAQSQDHTQELFMPDSLNKVILIQPTGEDTSNLPEMTLIPGNSELYGTVMRNINNSFIREFLDFYFIAQVFLKNNNKIDAISPAYLALTKNQGGFAKTGFSIKQGENQNLMENTPYVDIVAGHATALPGRLMSLTQLYPHEMGHVVYRMLSPEDTATNNTRSTDMHFFSTVTDYSTAFNEGFAEHIENVARVFEKNDSISLGIFADIDRIGKTTSRSIDGFERDFKYPFRLGYYKASMISWFQKYEDYRRYVLAMNGDIRFKNAELKLRNTEDQLSYRNSGVRLDRHESRNLVQLLSTEGAVSTFFTHLTTSALREHYLDPDFYRPFMYDSTMVSFSPNELFSPLQNQFIKYFYVLHHFVTFNNSSRSQLTDFIEGYMQIFPTEADSVKKIFKEVLGIESTDQVPPPLWMLVCYHPHRILIYDLYDAITAPVYTFDLNAAEAVDLQTIEGVSRRDAENIIAYREANGFFTSLDQLKDIQDLRAETSAKIISAAFDKDYFEAMFNDFDIDLSLGTLVKKLSQYFLLRAFGWFILISGIVYFILIRREKPGFKRSAIFFVRLLLLWILFIIGGLAAVVLSQQAELIIIFFSVILCLLTIFIYRNRKTHRLRSLIAIGAMGLAILVSVI